MKNKTKKIILPLATASAILLPIVGVISASTSASRQEFGGDNAEFSGTYLKDSYINIVKNGNGQGENAIFGSIYPGMSQNQWSNRIESREVYQNGVAYSSAFSGRVALANEHYDNVVKIEEITSSTTGNLFADAKKLVKRRWRAVFNNYYAPKNPNWNSQPSSSNYYQANSYGNLAFGLALTKNLQIVDNSMRITVIAKDSNYNPTSYPIIEGANFSGYIFDILNTNSATPLTTGNINIPNVYNNNNLDSYEPDQFIKATINLNSNNPFYDNFTNPGFGATFNDVYNKPLQLNNLKYATVDPNYENNIDNVNYLWKGVNNQSGWPDSRWQSLLGNFLPQASGSALTKNVTNIGSVFYGEVSTGNQNYRGSSYQPTIVVEFETIDNQSDFNINNTDTYTFTNTQNTEGGISAFFTAYGGTGYNYVAADSISYTRSNYRPIMVQVKEKAISSYIQNQNGLNNQYLTNNYGYALYYGDTLISSIPSSVIAKAKSNSYNQRTQTFELNLVFNTDVSKWPAGMADSYNSFMDPSKLVLKKVFDQPDAAQFFTNNNNHSIDQLPSDNGVQSLGGIFLDPNSLKYNGQIVFYSDTQWTGSNGGSNYGYWKLKLLDIANKNTAGTGTASPVNVYQSYTFNNRQLLPNQIQPFIDAVYSDWNTTHFANSGNLWWIQYNDLKQSAFNAENELQTAPNMSDIEAYNANINGTSDVINNVRNFLIESNWNNSLSDIKNKIDKYINFLYASDATKKAYMQAYTALVNWKDVSTPNFDTSSNNIVDKNQAARKIQDIIDTYVKVLTQLQTEKGIGFVQGQELTSIEFVNTANSIIDSLPLYSQWYKEQFKQFVLRQNSRQVVVDFIHALQELQTKVQQSQDMYDKYLPVDTNKDGVYTNIYNLEGKNNNLTFKNFDAAEKALLAQINAVKTIYGSSTGQETYVSTAKILEQIDSLKPETVPNAYHAITTDIDTFAQVIKSLTNLTEESKQAYIAQLNGVINPTSASDVNKYRLIENYQLREAQMAKIATTAQLEDTLLAQGKSWTPFAAQFNFDFLTTSLTNSIDKNDPTISTINNGTNKTVSVETSNNSHSNWNVVSQNGINIYIYPNTTIDSASVNYAWQVDAQGYIKNGTHYPSTTISIAQVNQNKNTHLANSILEQYKQLLDQEAASLTSQANVEALLGTQKVLLNAFVANLKTLYAQYRDLAKENPQVGGLNQAQYNSLTKDLYDTYYTNNLNNANDVVLAGNVTNWNSKMQTIVKAMNQLQNTVAALTTGSNSVFKNGQFYGIGNYDKYVEATNGSLNFAMPQANGELIALLSTALQVLQSNLANINSFVASNATTSDLVSAMKENNLPSVLSTTTFAQAKPYNWFVYSAQDVETLNAALNAVVAKLDGRYQAASQYAQYILDKYFGAINAVNQTITPLYSESEAQDQTKALKLNQATFTFANNADNIYYYKINQFIVQKATEYINSLPNVTTSDKQIAIATIQLAQNSVTFNDFDINQTTQPQWIWKVQAVLYQVSQINDLKANLITNFNADTALTKLQKDALIQSIISQNIFDTTTTNITNVSDALPKSYANLSKTLHKPLAKSDASELNSKMQALRNLLAQVAQVKVSDPLLINKASNLEAFNAALNPVENIDTISNTDPSQIAAWTQELQKQFDALNGYNQLLAQDVAAAQEIVGNYVTKPTYLASTVIPSSPLIKTLTNYQTKSKELMNAIAKDINSVVTKDINLTQAQKDAIQANVNATALSQDTLASYNTTVSDIKALSEQMKQLQVAYNAAKTFVSDNQTIYDQISNSITLKQAFQKALDQAAIVYDPYSEKLANKQNLSLQQATDLTNELKNSLAKLSQAIQVGDIAKILLPIDDSSPLDQQMAKTNILNKATNPNATAQELQKLTQEARNVIALTPLYKALANSDKITNPGVDLSNSIKAVENTLSDMVHGVKTPTSEQIQAQIEKLNNAESLDKLQKLIAQAKQVTNPSDNLKQALANAQTVATNKQAEQYQDQINKLSQALTKNPLYNAIENATATNTEYNLPSIKEAINNATAIASQDLSPEQVTQAINKLNYSVDRALLVHKARETLKDIIAQANTQNDNRNGFLKQIIDQSQTILNNPAASDQTIISQGEKLKLAINLDKFIQLVNKAKSLVPTSQASAQFTAEIANADQFISDWEDKINAFIDQSQDGSTYNTLSSALKQALEVQTPAVYMNTNANGLYIYANQLQTSITNPGDSTLQAYYSNFISNIQSLQGLVPNAVSQTTFQENVASTEGYQNVYNKLTANADYYKMEVELDKLSKLDPKQISAALANAMQDSNAIVQLGGAAIQFTSSRALSSSFNTLVPQMTAANLKNKNDKPLQLVIQAYENLILELNKNKLALAIATANKTLEEFSPKAGETLTPDQQAVVDKANALKEAISAAQTALNTANKDETFYNDAANGLTQATTAANSIVSALRDKLASAIKNANTVKPQSESLKSQVIAAQGLINSPDSSALDIVKAIDSLNKETAKDTLANAINNVSASLKNNPTFKQLALGPAQDVLSNKASTTQNYIDAAKTLANQIKKQELFNAYSKALKALQPVSNELNSLKQSALEMLNGTDASVLDKNQEFFDQEANKLLSALGQNNLANAIKEAQAIPVTARSDELSSALQDAINVAKTSSANSTEINNSATEKLLDAINKNSLAFNLAQAKNALAKFTPNNNQIDDAKAKKLREEMQQAIGLANQALVTPNQDKNFYQNAANTLAGTTAKLNDAYDNTLTELKDTVNSLQNEIASHNLIPSQALSQDLSELSNELANNAKNQNYFDLRDQENKLNYLVKSNSLANAVAQAIPVAANLPQFTNDILNNSNKMLANQASTQQELKAQTKLQELANIAANIITQIANDQYLNNAQKQALYNELENTLAQPNVNENSIETIKTKASSLEDNMKALNNYVQDIAPALKDNPISSIKYTYADANKQKAYMQALNNANSVLNKTTGGVIENNAPAAIGQYLTDLKNALNALNGNQNLDQIKQSASAQIDSASQLSNGNKYFNAPVALQNAYQKAIEQANEALKVVNQMESATDHSKTDALSKALGDVKNLENQINQFPDTAYQNGDDKIPNIDHVLDGLNNLSPSAKEQFKQAYNKTMNLTDANKVIQQAQEQNNKVADEINNISQQIKTAITALPNVDKQALSNISKQASDISSYAPAQKVADINSLVQSLTNADALIDALNQYKASDIKDSKTYNRTLTNLNNAIAKANKTIVAKPANIALAKELDSKVTNLQAQARELEKMVKALANNEPAAFSKAAQALSMTSKNPNYNALANELQNNNYFNILSTPKEKISKQQVAALNNILNSTAFKTSDNVIRSAIITQLKVARSNMPWWAYLILVSSILWVSGMIILYNRKK
ncbi:hypothetical protein ACM0IS_02265 [Mycoplasma aquilae ATCC BAA-1896]|uniref:hypothetical protein n=1 Tax=Mycoplasma aquilae TaxID=1312741 RepID=UPI003A894162